MKESLEDWPLHKCGINIVQTLQGVTHMRPSPILSWAWKPGITGFQFLSFPPSEFLSCSTSASKHWVTFGWLVFEWHLANLGVRFGQFLPTSMAGRWQWCPVKPEHLTLSRLSGKLWERRFSSLYFRRLSLFLSKGRAKQLPALAEFSPQGDFMPASWVGNEWNINCILAQKLKNQLKCLWNHPKRG